MDATNAICNSETGNYRNPHNFSVVLNSDYISREHLQALLILICSSAVIILTVCTRSAASLQRRRQIWEPHWRSSQGFSSLRKKSVTILLLHCMHLSSKPDTSALKQILRGLPWLQSHPVGSAMCQAFSILLWQDENPRGQKLSEASFYDFKARQNPQERRDLCQMAACRIPQALLTFTICLSDLSNNDAAFRK